MILNVAFLGSTDIVFPFLVFIWRKGGHMAAMIVSLTIPLAIEFYSHVTFFICRDGNPWAGFVCENGNISNWNVCSAKKTKFEYFFVNNS